MVGIKKNVKKNDQMIVVVPSRGRPSNIGELLQAFQDTCRIATGLWVCIDEDDPEVDRYRQVMREDGNPVLDRLIIGPPSRIGPILNRVMPEAAEQAPYIAFMGDDHRPRTQGWDQIYIQTLEDLGTGVVYGNDLYQGPNIPTQVAMTSNIVKATGHFVPPGAKHLYLDNMWADIGRATSLKYLPDVVVEHMHPCAGKAEWDGGYELNNSPETYSEDEAVYNAWKQNDLPVWAELIRNYRG
jgi:hypothetical protein